MSHNLGVPIVLFVFSLALAALPARTSKLLRLGISSSAWARFVGVLGLIWAVLAVLTDRECTLISLPEKERVFSRIMLHMLSGVIVGLILGLGANPKVKAQT
jgi:hypothetical protein